MTRRPRRRLPFRLDLARRLAAAVIESIDECFGRPLPTPGPLRVTLIHLSRLVSYFRRPKTTQEKRSNQDRRWCRPARRPARLPSDWDDDLKWGLRDRTWKRFRSTQYKPVFLPAF